MFMIPMVGCGYFLELPIDIYMDPARPFFHGPDKRDLGEVLITLKEYTK